MNNQEKIISQLNDLLTKNYDAEKGYILAAEKVSNTDLKGFLETRAKARYDFGHVLKDQITKLGGEPDKGPSIEGRIHRAWIGLKDTFTKGDHAIYEECVRGEETFVEEYEDFLKDREHLPETIVLILQEQLTEGRKALAEVKALEKFTK